MIEEIVRYERTVVPVMEQLERDFWHYARTGSPVLLQRIDSLQDVKAELLHNERSFAYLKQLREKGSVHDEYLKRQLEILYRQYLPYQVDYGLLKRVNRLQSHIKNEVWTKAKGKSLQTGEDVPDSFKEHVERTALKDSLLLLVKLRNEWADQVGFQDYYQLRLFLDEQEPAAVDSIFSRLERQTEEAYLRIKQEVRHPWHYRGVFSRYGQREDNTERNNVYGYANMQNIALRFFSGIGFELDDVLANSDFEYNGNKLPVVRCISVDRKDEIHLIGMLNGTETDMLRLLACCGEAAYWKSIPNTLPYLLRCPSSTMLQVGVSSFFSRLIGYPDWMLAMGIFSAGQAGAMRGSTYPAFVREQLFFCRWSLLMYEFERKLYEDPDSDLSALWEELNLRYLLRQVDPEIRCQGRVCPRYARLEWASEPYFLLDACQMHNYLLGELWAAQVTAHLCGIYPKLGSPCNPMLVGNEEVGAYLREFVFEPGACLQWQDLTRQATGQDLSVDSFVEQFCKTEK
ncbi:MAG: hypothetical protein NC396_06765 [Bacteroides sp.]|nr:hypothetical protein [Bacteroides sp.]MCM1086059.1 hypothetical protein [Bacteroides sp.]